ncbi:MAG: ribokinase [Anaerolineae bacterium]|nr:ribokinase [Anaerolineae bacterium]
MTNRVVVVGSANTDMIVRCDHIPQPGETVLGGEFVTAAGGKGANQAVSAARLGAEVAFIARLGADIFGDKALEGYKAEGINTDAIIRDPGAPSGVALIIVDSKAENSIAVAPGANSRLSPADVEAAEALIAKADVMLLQLEIPLDTVAAAARIARRQGVQVILNPAPATTLSPELLSFVDVLTPNAGEARRLAGLPPDDPTPRAEVAQILRRHGIEVVVMTLGAEGALAAGPGGAVTVPGFEVTPVDTTGAGDGFNAGLAVALARDPDDLQRAVRYGNAVGALTATKVGAQPALPRQSAVEALLAGG